jgi:two-component system sensor histidine kinase RegB
LRQQEAQAVVQREDRLRNDQIMAVASLAAGTAHELGTPLSTMTVLVDEMLQTTTATSPPLPGRWACTGARYSANCRNGR